MDGGTGRDHLVNGMTCGHGRGEAAPEPHEGAHAAVAATEPAGPGVAEHGDILVPETTTLPPGRPADLRLRILGPEGEYRHLHPTRDATGRWSVRPLPARPPRGAGHPGTIRFAAALPSAGRYRLPLQVMHEGRVRTVAHPLDVSR
jgi:hypothetical protein